MKIYMTMKVEGAEAGYADAKIEISDDLLQYFVKQKGANRLAEFVATEAHAYVIAMARKNIEMGKLRVPS